MRLLIINGPNLNLLGRREPEVYGHETLADLEGRWRHYASTLGIGITTFQSNHEGAIIDTIQADGPRVDAIVINPGALSHSSYAIHDALVAVSVPTVEVHISNIHEREPWRRVSVTGAAASYMIYGRGVGGYVDAINLMWARLVSPSTTVRYGDHPDQVIDVRTHADPKGLVVLVHGGFWKQVWARDTIDPLAAALHREGWATANVEYRRGPGSYDTSAADVATAIEFLYGQGGPGVAGLRPILVGHSAGGYLALRAASSNGRLAGAIGLGSVIDLPAISAARPDDDPVEAYLGVSRADGPDLWDDAALDGALGVPVHLIHGSADDTTPIDHARSWSEGRDGASLTVIDGGSHMDVVDPRHGAFQTLLETLNQMRP